MFNGEEAIFDENRKRDILDQFFENTFKSTSLPDSETKIDEEDINWLMERFPNFSYKKAPGMDGLLDIMIQPPKQLGEFITAINKT